MQKLDLKSDGHVHTSLCGHAVGSMEDYVRAAIDRGLERLYFLEHLEAGINYFETTWLSDDDFDRYFEEGSRLKEKYRDLLFVGLGVETGYNPERVDEILGRLAARKWDRIAVSYHFMRVGDRHFNLVSRKGRNMDVFGRVGVERVVSDYFDAVLASVKTIPADVVCHLDAVLRYHPGLSFSEKNYRQIGLIIDAMADRGMALEINASGCRMRDEPFPALDIIEEAVRRKVKLMVGSDAHRPQDVGDFSRLAECLKKSSVELNY